VLQSLTNAVFILEVVWGEEDLSQIPTEFQVLHIIEFTSVWQDQLSACLAQFIANSSAQQSIASEYSGNYSIKTAPSTSTSSKRRQAAVDVYFSAVRGRWLLNQNDRRQTRPCVVYNKSVNNLYLICKHLIKKTCIV